MAVWQYGSMASRFGSQRRVTLLGGIIQTSPQLSQRVFLYLHRDGGVGEGLILAAGQTEIDGASI
jgi:hypothetical protein